MSDTPPTVTEGFSPAEVDALIAHIEEKYTNPHTAADLLATAFAFYVQKHFERPGPQGMQGHVDVDMPNLSVSLAQPQASFPMRVTLHPR